MVNNFYCLVIEAAGTDFGIASSRILATVRAEKLPTSYLRIGHILFKSLNLIRYVSIEGRVVNLQFTMNSQLGHE